MIVILHAWSHIFPDLPIHDEIPWEIDSNLYCRKPWDFVVSHLASIIPELSLLRLLSFLIFPKPFHVLLGGNCENSNHRVECCDVNWFVWMIHVCFYMWVDTHLQMHGSLGFDLVRLFATLFCWIHEALGVLMRFTDPWSESSLALSQCINAAGNPCDIVAAQELCHWHNSSWDALSAFSRTMGS